MGKGKVTVEGNSRKVRQQRRKVLGTLSSLTVHPRTRQRYDRALGKFFAYLQWHRITLASTALALDAQLADYVEYLWQEGDSRYLGGDTVAAIQDAQPELKGSLLKSWRLLKTWARHELPARAPPLTPRLVYALCGWFVKRNMSACALAIHLAFVALLRTGEMLGLQSKHIQASKSSGQIVLNLQATKTSHRHAVLDSVVVSNFQLAWHLQAWQTQVSAETYLVSMSCACFRARFATALQELHLSNFPFKPYSLRRGGATALFQAVQSFSKVCHVGRWQTERSCRLYIQDASASLTDMRLSPCAYRDQMEKYWTGQLGLASQGRDRMARGRGRKL